MKSNYLNVLLMVVVAALLTACEWGITYDYTSCEHVYVGMTPIFVVNESNYYPIKKKECQYIYTTDTDTILVFTYTERIGEQQQFVFCAKKYPSYAIFDIEGSVSLDTDDGLIALWNSDSKNESDTTKVHLREGKYAFVNTLSITEKSNKPTTNIYTELISSKESLKYNWIVNFNNEEMHFNADSAIISFDVENMVSDSYILIDSVVVKGIDNPYYAYSNSLPSTLETHVFLNEDRRFAYKIEAYYKKQPCDTCSYSFYVHKSEIIYEESQQNNISGTLYGFRE